MRLSKRLETIIKQTKLWVQGQEGDVCVADVGTDHGFVPICLIERGIVSRALALDVREGPLMRAQGHVLQHGLEGKIGVRLSDGLKGLRPQEADVVVIAGMGGELMLRILEEGGHMREFVQCFILSPQSELPLFRHGLEKLGLLIRDEVMVEEDGKYYTVMTAVPGKMHYPKEYCYRYGERLIADKSRVLAEFLEKEIGQLLKIRGQLLAGGGDGVAKRLQEIEEKLREAGQVRELLAEGEAPGCTGKRKNGGT